MREDPGYLFVAGAPKAGTTSVARWLDDRPEATLIRHKEPRRFTDFAERDWTGPARARFLSRMRPDAASYEADFAVTAATRWKVDASTDYLSCSASPGMIDDFAREGRDVRVILILRDPVERIVSEFRHTLRDGWQTGTLRASLDAEAERIAAGWVPLFHHTARSRYAGPVADYAKRFGDRLLILDYHEMKAGDGHRERIARFLGLAYDADVVTPMPVANEGSVPRSRMLRRAMGSGRVHAVARATLPGAVRRRIWDVASELNRGRYDPSPDEIDHARALLADDIAACRDDPRIPTGNWRTAIAGG